MRPRGHHGVGSAALHRFHPTPEGKVRPRIQPGGKAPRRADRAPAGGAAAQGGSGDISSRHPPGEVRRRRDREARGLL